MKPQDINESLINTKFINTKFINTQFINTVPSSRYRIPLEDFAVYRGHTPIDMHKTDAHKFVAFLPYLSHMFSGRQKQ